MKTSTLKIAKFALTSLTAVFGLTAFANGPLVNPATGTDVVSSLTSQVLGKDQVADLFDTNARTVQPITDLEYFAGVRTAAPISSEGMPGTDTGDITDLIANAYSAPDLVALALRDRNTLPIGERIRFLEEQAARIIRISGARPTETLLRLTLNRSTDVVHHILPMVGVNTAEVTRLLANFMRENFELAASFANNSIGVDSRITQNATRSNDVAQFLSKLSIAEYGRVYASLLWRYSQELTSDSSKAVLLMRLVGYLGWDMNSDLRRREKPIAQTIADIYMLQHSPLYDRLVQTLAADQEPRAQDVAQLRRQVYTIIERLPQRLSDAGISQR